MIATLTRFLIDDDGPTAVEYAVLLALILVACLTIVGTLGKNASSAFTTVNSKVSSANGS